MGKAKQQGKEKSLESKRLRRRNVSQKGNWKKCLLGKTIKKKEKRGVWNKVEVYWNF